MDITIADQRIVLITNSVTKDEATILAKQKKLDSFGTVDKVTSFLSKPKDEDFEILYEEHRLQPFWHVSAKAHYKFDRNVTYSVPTSGTEVQSVSYHKDTISVSNAQIQLPVVEHCSVDENHQITVDGVSGKTDQKLTSYTSLPYTVISSELRSAVSETTIIVPPTVRISAIMRETLSKMIKGIQADVIHEEKVEVTTVDLVYRPVYAFQYRWKSKNKEAIVEVDAATGVVSTGNRTFREYFGKVLDQNFLFDIGADAAGMILPGGSIAVKIAKKYIDQKQK